MALVEAPYHHGNGGAPAASTAACWALISNSRPERVRIAPARLRTLEFWRSRIADRPAAATQAAPRRCPTPTVFPSVGDRPEACHVPRARPRGSLPPAPNLGGFAGGLEIDDLCFGLRGAVAGALLVEGSPVGIWCLRSTLTPRSTKTPVRRPASVRPTFTTSASA